MANRPSLRKDPYGSFLAFITRTVDAKDAGI